MGYGYRNTSMFRVLGRPRFRRSPVRNMKASGKTIMPIIVEMDRTEAQLLLNEIYMLTGRSIDDYPKLKALYSNISEVERRYKSAEYQGPG